MKVQLKMKREQKSRGNSTVFFGQRRLTQFRFHSFVVLLGRSKIRLKRQKPHLEILQPNHVDSKCVHRHHTGTKMSSVHWRDFLPAQSCALSVQIGNILEHGKHCYRIAENKREFWSVHEQAFVRSGLGKDSVEAEYPLPLDLPSAASATLG